MANVRQITTGTMTPELINLCEDRRRNPTRVELIIPQGTRDIPNRIFFGCEALVSIRFPDSLIAIKNESFAGCYNLRTVQFPANSNLVEIGESAFTLCQVLEELEFPASLTRIHKKAFESCRNLRRVSFPANSVFQRLSSETFRNCSALQELVLPSTLNHIGHKAFYQCRSLQTIHCRSTQLGLLLPERKKRGVISHLPFMPNREVDETERKRDLVAKCKGAITTPTGDQYDVTFTLPLFGDHLVFDPVKQVKDQYPDVFGDESFTLIAQSTDGGEALPLARHSIPFDYYNYLFNLHPNFRPEAIQTEYTLVDIFHGKIDFNDIILNFEELPESDTEEDILVPIKPNQTLLK